MKKYIHDNQLSITDDLNDFPVISYEIKPSDFFIYHKNFGYALKNVHHKINLRSNYKNLYPVFSPYYFNQIDLERFISFSDFNQPYFKTR